MMSEVIEFAQLLPNRAACISRDECDRAIRRFRYTTGSHNYMDPMMLLNKMDTSGSEVSILRATTSVDCTKYSPP